MFQIAFWKYYMWHHSYHIKVISSLPMVITDVSAAWIRNEEDDTVLSWFHSYMRRQ